MAQAKLTQEKNNFVGGLITEASALAFPPNASLFEQNFELRRDGTRRRRLGMEPEIETPTSYTSTTVGRPARYQTFLWENASNTERSILMTVSSQIAVFRYADTQPLDQGSDVIGSLILEAAVFDLVVSTSQGNLIVPSGGETINVISYDDSGNGSITITPERIKVRDVWGVDDTLDLEERPNLLTTDHKYNLGNQGWLDSTLTSPRLNGNTLYPSNADIIWYARQDNGDFDFSTMDDSGTGTTPAPKGKYIIDAFDRNSDREANLPNKGQFEFLLKDSTDFSLRSCASFAGRMFYAGRVLEEQGFDQTNSPRFDATLFFTRTLEKAEDYGKCYQEADPTAEDSVGLLPNDGGTIVIPECNVILGLYTIGNALVVFGGNGIWSVTGTAGGVFAADAYDVLKVSDIGVISIESILVLEQDAVFWADSGIYILSPDPTSGRLGVRNLTENTIQSYYLGIPSLSKKRTVGYYDKLNRQIRFLYKETEPNEFVYNDYNAELIYDLSLQAFYIYRFERNNILFQSGDEDHIFPVQYMPLPSASFSTVQEELTLVDGTTGVTLADGTTEITTPNLRAGSQAKGHKYLAHYSTGSAAVIAVVSDYTNEDFEDFSIANDNNDAEAILITGQATYGDTQRRKMINNLTLHFERTETGFTEVSPGMLEAVGESSCLVSTQWDFADDPVSGKFGREFQGYRLKRPYIPSGPNDDFNYGYDVITTKNKLRGTGRALSLQFKTEPGKDCHLLGWAYDVSGESVV